MKVTALVPPQGYPECGANPSAWSVVLRVDYGSSSILFTGDPAALEEVCLAIDAPERERAM